MNWEALINKKIIAPFRPNINDQEDVKYFDDEFVELPLRSPEENISESNMIYTNFSYAKSYLVSSLILIRSNF